MRPRGPLMIEHRLIEKMMRILADKIPKIREAQKVEPAFIDPVIDFMRTYTDKIHHGKEEAIYFRECAKKEMTAAEARMLKELLHEHEISRRAVETIAQARKRYPKEENALEVIVEKLEFLVEIYRGHIDKEDHRFFPDSEKYFSEAEQAAMLKEFLEFDKKMVQEKYKAVVEDLQKGLLG